VLRKFQKEKIEYRIRRTKMEMKFGKFKKIMQLLVVLHVLAALVVVPFAFGGTALYKGKPAKYVLFFIGDGMAVAAVAMAEKYKGEQLNMNKLPVVGITTTYSSDSFIPDSAATATSMASAVKTNNGALGMDANRRHVRTMAEIAKEKGMKVGIVSSVSIDHATPAAFYSHVAKRSQYYDVDIYLAESGFDFFGGGGIKDPGDKKKKSKNYKGNALELAKKNGYKVVTNKADFKKIKPGDGKILAWNAWLPDGQALPYVLDTTAEDITLVEFTKKAIEMIDNPKGFFLMVEGGKIDWTNHANDAANAIQNTLMFDDAVKVGMDFAKKHPGETLVVVTGDHECGGLTLGFAGTKYGTHYEILSEQNMSHKIFTDKVLKEFQKKHGPKAKFADIQPLITKYFGLKFKGDPKEDRLVVKDYELAQLEAAFKRTMDIAAGKAPAKPKGETYNLYGNYDPLAVTVTHILNRKAGIGYTSYSHTAAPVQTTAIGVGAETFGGYYDNTDLAKKIMAVMGIAPRVHFISSSEEIKVAVNY
jgi:alkaline phosphatase